ncbi:MAG TPA: hypothetical protein VLK88_05770 [Gemmatimonadales bacterium]|nr:hypothetical protein [Gemmatimonadales bacterium]
MRNSLSRLCLAALVLAALHCSSGTGPGGGGGGGGNSGLTAKIDGAAWEADPISIAANAMAGIPGGLLIHGSQTTGGVTRSINIALQNIRGTGTYALGVGPSVYGGIASEGEGSGGGGNANVWLTPLNGVSGTLTINTLGAGRIVGSFEFTGDADNNNSVGGTRTITQGVFDLPFTGNIVPVPANVGSKISADLNGVPYNAWDAFGELTVFTGGAGVDVNSTSSENAVFITLVGVTAPGTYALSNVSPEKFILVGLNGGNASTCCWGLNAGGDVGSVIVTSLTPDRVQGTFSGTLQPQPGKPASAPLTITNGVFDIGIQ